MGLTKKERLEMVLNDVNTTQGVEGSAVITRDGLLIVSAFKTDIDADTFAAMSATMFGAAETALHEINKGIVEIVTIESKQCKLIAVNSYQEGILVAFVQTSANLSSVLGELKKAADQTKKIMEET